MTKGTKNYFRHSIFMHQDPKIIGIIDQIGVAGYGRLLILVELMAAQEITNECKGRYVFRRSQLCRSLRLVERTLNSYLTIVEQQLNISVTIDKHQVLISYDNMLKFIGSYNSSSPNKRKENKIKVNKIKEEKEKEILKESIEEENDKASQNIDSFLTQFAKTKSDYINPTQVIELFNSKIPRASCISAYTPYSLPPQSLEDFKTLTGFKEFSTIEKFENYFSKILESDFLTKKCPRSFLWFLKPDNAFKILAEEYKTHLDPDDIRVNPFKDGE